MLDALKCRSYMLLIIATFFLAAAPVPADVEDLDRGMETEEISTLEIDEEEEILPSQEIVFDATVTEDSENPDLVSEEE